MGCFLDKRLEVEWPANKDKLNPYEFTCFELDQGIDVVVSIFFSLTYTLGSPPLQKSSVASKHILAESPKPFIRLPVEKKQLSSPLLFLLRRHQKYRAKVPCLFPARLQASHRQKCPWSSLPSRRRRRSLVLGRDRLHFGRDGPFRGPMSQNTTLSPQIGQCLSQPLSRRE